MGPETCLSKGSPRAEEEKESGYNTYSMGHGALEVYPDQAPSLKDVRIPLRIEDGKAAGIKA